MKYILTFFSFFAALVINAQDAYELKVKIAGLKQNDTCFLANYFGDKQYIQDTALIDANGKAVFSGDKKLPGGIYLVIVPGKKYFEMIVTDDQSFSMETDSADWVKNMKVSGSEENKLFYEYLTFISGKQKEIEPLRVARERVKNKPDSMKIVNEKMTAIDNAVKNYKLDFIKSHPNTFVSKIFKTMQEPEIPPAPDKKDSTFAYRYYKAHYFDNVDFSDDRILRTPLFHNKLKYYLESLTVQHWDSIAISAEYLAEKAKANKEVFKYVVQYITYTYESSKVMGMENVFVFMVNKYHKTGQVTWIDSSHLGRIIKRADQLEPVLIGKKAPNLVMQDSTYVKTYDLHKLNAKYTIVYFWDPDCGHCQKETPKLHEMWVSKLKNKGVVVYAVGSISEVDPWKKYIRDKKLTWLNVIDAYNKNNYKHKYDIFSTPVIYILDENKKIIAKRLESEQVEGFLDRYMKMMNK